MKARYLKCGNGGAIWLQIGDESKLVKLEEDIRIFFSDGEARARLTKPVRGQVCIVKSGAKQERCLRARIVRLFNSQVGKQATVLHIDHAVTELVSVFSLFICPSKFLSVLPFACCCFLNGVDLSLLTCSSANGSTDAEWRKEANQFFLRLIHESSLTIDIKKKDAHGNCHVVLHATSSDGMNKVCVNDLLQSSLLSSSTEVKEAAVCIPRLPHFVNTQEMQKSQLESFAETKRVLLGIQLESQVATSHQQRAARMSCALAEMLGIPQHSDEGKGRTTVVDDLASIDKSGKLMFKHEVFLSRHLFPSGCLSLHEAPFPKEIVDILNANSFPGPTLIQSHCWRSILRGHDVVGVSRSNTGKTLAYLLPLLSTIYDSALYTGLPEGIGPLVVILSPYWQKAESIHKEIAKYCCHTDSKKHHFVLYGAGTELSKLILLMNGCDILVATPHSLLRALKRGQTSLNRLCHLVFDDADILVHYFHQQVCDLMSQFAAVLREGRGKSSLGGTLASSCQKLVFSSSWTSGVASLVSAYFANPLTVITSRLDAMIYCDVVQTISQCELRDIVCHLRGLLKSEAYQKHDHIVVFSEFCDDVKLISKELSGLKWPVVACHHEMSANQIYDVNMELSQLTHHGIIVSTDSNSQFLDLSNCSLCIHLDFPHSKSHFSDRLDSLRNSACNGQSCESALVVTERSINRSLEILELLKKFGCSIPSWLKANVKKVSLLMENEKKHLPIHPDLLSFGWRNDSSINYRQRLWKEKDAMTSDCLVGVPMSGLIQVLVSHVESVCCYWGRILNHSHEDGAFTQSVQSQYVALNLELNQWFSKASNRKIVQSLKTGMRYAVRLPGGIFYRAEIVNCSKDVLKCRLIDTGAIELVHKDNMFVLPGGLQDTSPQAVKMYLCQVKPVDRDVKWTVEANEFASHLVKGKELQGKIVMRLRGCVWLDPLVEKRNLQGLNVMDTVLNVNQELIKAGMAEPNPHHMAVLKQIAAVALPDKYEELMQWQENVDDAISLLDHLTLEEQGYQDIIVSAVVHPGLFFVQAIEWIERLHELEVDINLNLPAKEPELTSKLHIGSYCLAQFSVDNKWYRARILERHNDECCVLFVDHGEDEWLDVNQIRPIAPHMLSFPIQAIECSLSSAVPCDEEWSRNAADLLHRLSANKTLVLEVKGVSSATVTAGLAYEVDLFDTTGCDDISLAEQLIDAGVAFAATSVTSLEELRQEEANNCYEHWSQKIADFCSIIQRSNSSQERVEAAQLMRHTVNQSIDYENFQKYNGLQSMLRLVSHCSYDLVLEHVVSSLACLLNHKMICEAALRYDVCRRLTQLVVQTDQSVVQEAIISCFQNLLQIDSVADLLRDEGAIKHICNLMLVSSSSPPLLSRICNLLFSLSKDNLRNSDVVRIEGGVKAVVRLVGNCDDNSVQEQAVRCLETLAKNAKNRDSICLHGGIVSLCKQVRTSQSRQFIELALSSLQILIYNSKENALASTKADLLKSLDKVESSVGSIVDLLCSQLRMKISELTDLKERSSSHKEKARSQFTEQRHQPTQSRLQSVSVRPISVHRSSSGFLNKSPVRVKPFVRWWQTKQTVVLSIQLRGVSDRHIKLTRNKIEFRSIVNATEYYLDIELFSNVIPENSREHVTGSQLCLILGKEEESKWPRLLATREKVLQIGVDFDHLDDEDESVLPLTEETQPLDLNPFLAVKEDKKELVCLPPEEVTHEDNSDSSDDEGREDADIWNPFQF